jgi:hypothetical protein
LSQSPADLISRQIKNAVFGVYKSSRFDLLVVVEAGISKRAVLQWASSSCSSSSKQQQQAPQDGTVSNQQQ